MTVSSQAGRRLIVTADDFGLDIAVNEAVEQGWCHGILTAASLMVTGGAAADAVRRARRLPGLAVGLHLVLVDGLAALPPAEVDLLADDHGRFRDNMVTAGMRFFAAPRGRRQLAAEIRAQFEAFRRTGLVLDHVNAHKHFHLHPTVLSTLIHVGRDYGLRAVRFPRESRGGGPLLPWLALMRRRLRRAGLLCNDRIVGVAQTGGMDERVVLDALSTLPRGVSEMYFHPATTTGLTPAMAEYRHTDELESLLSPRVVQAIERGGIERIAFRDLH